MKNETPGIVPCNSTSHPAIQHDCGVPMQYRPSSNAQSIFGKCLSSQQKLSDSFHINENNNLILGGYSCR